MATAIVILSICLSQCTSQREPINGKCESSTHPLLVTEQIYGVNSVGDVSSHLVGKCVSEAECDLFNIGVSNLDSIGRWSCLQESTCIPHYMPCKEQCASPYRNLVEDCNETADRRGACLLHGQPCGNTCSWSNVTPFGKVAPITGRISCVPYCHRTEEWQCEQNCMSKKAPCEGKCSSDHWYCRVDNACIPLKWVCDGKELSGCSDHSDENNCGTCAHGMEKCGNSIRCIDWTRPCNGECPLGSKKCSEDKCVTHKESCEGTCLDDDMIACGSKCYHPSKRCDGKKNCEHGEDETNCGACSIGSRKCGVRLICFDDYCSLEDKATTIAKSAADCTCSQYWCERENKCMSRNNKDLQSCEALWEGYPSVGPTIFKNVTGNECDSGIWDGSVFKQGSCVPTKEGKCPTSFLLENSKIRFWVKCGDTCWSKEILTTYMPARYADGQCHQEDFSGLCTGDCKYYDAWLCDSTITCTDVPCKGKCPSKLTSGVSYYMCNNTRCIPEIDACDGKCPEGLFQCEDKCIHPNVVCDGRSDCANGLDERKEFCDGCQVGQGICNGKPQCMDTLCDGECMSLKDDTKLVNCGYESDRNICSLRTRTCDYWMTLRYGALNPT